MDARRRHALFVEPYRNAVEAGRRDAGGRTVLIPVNVLLDRHAPVVPAVECQRDKRLAILCERPRAVIVTVVRARYRAAGTEMPFLLRRFCEKIQSDPDSGLLKEYNNENLVPAEFADCVKRMYNYVSAAD